MIILDYEWIMEIVDMLKLFIIKIVSILWVSWTKIILFEPLKIVIHGWYTLSIVRRAVLSRPIETCSKSNMKSAKDVEN